MVWFHFSRTESQQFVHDRKRYGKEISGTGCSSKRVNRLENSAVCWNICSSQRGFSYIPAAFWWNGEVLSLKTIVPRPSEHAASQLRYDLAARIAVQSQDSVHQGICVRSDQSYGHYRRQTDASKLAAEPFSWRSGTGREMESRRRLTADWMLWTSGFEVLRCEECFAKSCRWVLFSYSCFNCMEMWIAFSPIWWSWTQRAPFDLLCD